MRSARSALLLVAAAVAALTPAGAAVAGDDPPTTTCLVTNGRTSTSTDVLATAVADAIGGDTLTLQGQCFLGATVTIDKNLTIVGSTADGVPTVDGADSVRLFDLVGSPKVTFKTITLTNGEASGSGATGGGGAIRSTGQLTLTSVTVSSNTGVSGGAIYVNGGSLTINGASRIHDNLGTSVGGAISTTDVPATTITIKGTSVLHHNQSPYGGAITPYNATVTIGGSAVLRNNSVLAGGSGGAIAAEGSFVTFTDSAVVRNNSASYGGAIQSQNLQLDVLKLGRIVVSGKARLTGNTSDLYGAAINAEGRVTLTDNAVISGNTNTNKRGAVETYGYDSEPASFTMKGNARIKGNTSATGGAGLVIWTGCGSVPVVKGITGRVINNTPKNVKKLTSAAEC